MSDESRIEEKEEKDMEKVIELFNLKKQDAMEFRKFVDEFTDYITSLNEEEPLDGDDVDIIVNLIRTQLNRKEGNW